MEKVCKNCTSTLTEGIYHIPANEVRNNKLEIECIVKGLFTRYNKLNKGE